MAQQTINIGTYANKGDGDPIRVAFTKVNANFTDLYARVVVLEGGGVAVAQDIQGDIFAQDSSLAYSSATNTHYGSFVGALDGDVTGSVFGDNSTLLVDGVNSKIVGAVETASLRTSESKIALGLSAGETNQGSDAIAIGEQAGQTNQGQDAVAIGDEAGQNNQGAESVAIGNQAGETNQAANSIVINATGIALQNTTASSLVIKPIRSATMTTILGYDATSGEVTHNATIPGYVSLTTLKTEVAASADFADFQVRIAAL